MNAPIELTVALGRRSYPVIIGSGIDAGLIPELRKRFAPTRFVAVSNSTVASVLQPTLQSLNHELTCPLHTISDGEQYKTIQTWSSILDCFVSGKLDRGSVVLAIGGGVVGDITGFAAAAYQRGIRYVQIPTTLLAMVDSSVGGKCAINHPAGKNLIGAFHQPSLVWIDTAYLDTLSQRQFIAGYAEVFKYAFIGGQEMFRFILDHHDNILSRKASSVLDAVRRSVEIKAGIVAQDERESGVRALLNFGHTFGHALEQYYEYRALLHGEAVLWGIACACELGQRCRTIPDNDRSAYDRLLSLLPRAPLPDRPDPEALYGRMALDKKTSGGRRTFILPASSGSSIIRNDIDREQVIAAMCTVLNSWNP